MAGNPCLFKLREVSGFNGTRIRRALEQELRLVNIHARSCQTFMSFGMEKDNQNACFHVVIQ
jgi:hypothetical protein